MDRFTLSIYTAAEIARDAMPFLVNGRVNPAVPPQPGVYVLLDDKGIVYVGKTTAQLSKRLQSYRHEPTFTRVWWHVLDPSWADVYELLYLRQLDPPLNGQYHPGRGNYVRYRGRLVDEKDLTLAQRQEAHAELQAEVNRFLGGEMTKEPTPKRLERAGRAAR